MGQSYRALIVLVSILGLAAEPNLDNPDKPVRLRCPAGATPENLCGVDSLFLCYQLIGIKKLSLPDLQKEFTVDGDGVSLDALIQNCHIRGVVTTFIHCSLPQLLHIYNPVILHVNGSHFIVFLGTETERTITAIR